MSQHHAQLPAIQFNLNLKNHTSEFKHDDEQLGLGNDANVNAQSVPCLWGMPLKYVSLVTLAVQNSMLTIIMHYSRVSTPPSRAYSAATAVLLNEVLKGFISLVIAFTRIDASGVLPPPYPIDSSAVSHFSGSPWNPRVVWFRVKRLVKDVSTDCWKLSIPAILYVIQNNLQFVAVSNLDAATFQVSYQMKILTTAGFSVLLLRKKLSSTQWFALLCLAIGVGIVQIQAGASKTVTTSAASSLDMHSMNPTKGFMAVAAACFTSGLAGVYFEMVLKNSQGDLWVRNVQLSLFSLLPALVPVVFSRTSGSTSGGVGWFAGLFRNFGVWAWATVAVQVFGGLVTALVIKYSDNILKGFATSLSIVISFLASVVLFDFQMTFTFILGSVIVLIATWLYNQQHRRPGLVAGKDSIDWSLCWVEKGRVPTSSIRSPAVEPVYPGLAALSSSSSRSSSSVSLSSLSSSTTVLSSTPLSNSDNLDGKDKKKLLSGR